MIPAELCVDANILIAAMIPDERHHAQAVEVMRIVEENEVSLFEPEVILFEVGTAAYRKKREGEISESQEERMIELLFRFPLLFQWRDSLMKRVNRLASEMGSRGIGDGCYLAVAERRGIPLVTLDEELIRKGRRIYPKILSPADFLKLV